MKGYKDLLLRFREDIIFFVNKCLIEPYNKANSTNYFITGQQEEGLLSVQEIVHAKKRGEMRDILGVSIMSGKGTGKDAMTSWSILWFLFCFGSNIKVPCVSVSADQLNKVLWSEISKWLLHSYVKDYFVLHNDKLFRKDVDESVRGKTWFAFTKAANPKSSHDEQVETLAGCHADYLMQIVDEGSGVLDPVYQALEQNQTGPCNFMLVIFNPMHSKGYAKDTQYKNRHRWTALRWNSEESEITDKENIKRIEEDYGGKNSNTYRMNVLGLPPVYDEQTLINWDWVMASIDRPIVFEGNEAMIKAIDCGAGGDMSIIATRVGYKVYPFERNNSADSTEVTNWAGVNIDKDDPDSVKVDTIGIGWAVEGNLREKKGAIIEAADCRRTADDPERFINKRAEMYWNLREVFEKGLISIPNDSNLLNALAATKYELDNRGRIKIIEKKKIKSEIGYSPDELDALAMLFFSPNVTKKTVMPYKQTKRKGTWMAA